MINEQYILIAACISLIAIQFGVIYLMNKKENMSIANEERKHDHLELITVKELVKEGRTLQSLTADELYGLYQDTEVTRVVFSSVESEIIRRLNANN